MKFKKKSYTRILFKRHKKRVFRRLGRGWCQAENECDKSKRLINCRTEFNTFLRNASHNVILCLRFVCEYLQIVRITSGKHILPQLMKTNFCFTFLPFLSACLTKILILTFAIWGLDNIIIHIHMIDSFISHHSFLFRVTCIGVLKICYALSKTRPAH